MIQVHRWGVRITIPRPASILNALIRARPSPESVSAAGEGPLSGTIGNGIMHLTKSVESSGQTCHIERMSIHIISVKLADELRRLYIQLPNAHARAAAVLRADPPSHMLEGKALARFLAEEEKVASIVRRIKEIHGEE